MIKQEISLKPDSYIFLLFCLPSSISFSILVFLGKNSQLSDQKRTPHKRKSTINGCAQLPKVNACPTSTVATATTRAFPNVGSVTADRIAAWETTNSPAPGAGKRNSAARTRTDACPKDGGATDRGIAPTGRTNAIAHPTKVSCQIA